jgi:hypothetical protein
MRYPSQAARLPPQRHCADGDRGRGSPLKTMMRHCSLLLVVLVTTAICVAQSPQVETPKIETTYDGSKDRTTVRLAPVQISGEKDKYHSLHMAPSFSFPGHELQRPSKIDFELQTIVKARLLDSDLYVVFIVDGETIFLSSSNRRAVMLPVPGRRWIGEQLIFNMPYGMLLKITKAKKFEIKFDGVRFEVGETQLQALRDFADQIENASGSTSTSAP